MGCAEGREPSHVAVIEAIQCAISCQNSNNGRAYWNLCDYEELRSTAAESGGMRKIAPGARLERTWTRTRFRRCLLCDWVEAASVAAGGPPWNPAAQPRLVRL